MPARDATGTNPSEQGRMLEIAVFSGPNSTIQSTPPLVTSDQARRRHRLPPLDSRGPDALRPQRLAAPVTVYIEAFSGHPLEQQSAHLFASPDGYLNAEGAFDPDRRSEGDVPVYRAVLAPEDGLYLLPYMARRADGRPFEGGGDDEPSAPQHQYADARRLFEEIDRFGLDSAGHNGLLANGAHFSFFRPAPSGGYPVGSEPAGAGDPEAVVVAPEVPGEDYFPYSHRPTTAALARLTNEVQAAMSSGRFDGAIWLEGSPSIEETGYWLNLLIDTAVPICCNASQRPHGVLSNDGDRNIVDSVEYIGSRLWAGADGLDEVGVVIVQDQRAFSAREVQKADARPGGYRATGGHGGIVAALPEGHRALRTFTPARRHTHRSEVHLGRLPDTVPGVRQRDGDLVAVPVAVKDDAGRLLAAAIPKVTVCTWTRFTMLDGDGDPAEEVEIAARIDHNLEHFALAGFVLEGNAPFGKADQSMTRALERAARSGMPVVRVGRGNADGFTPTRSGLFVAGSNLSATKARLLLMACLLRFGAAPPLRPHARGDAAEQQLEDYLTQLQAVFDSH